MFIDNDKKKISHAIILKQILHRINTISVISHVILLILCIDHQSNNVQNKELHCNVLH